MPRWNIRRRAVLLVVAVVSVACYLALAIVPPYWLSTPWQNSLYLPGSGWYALPPVTLVGIFLAIIACLSRRAVVTAVLAWKRPGWLQLAYAFLFYLLSLELLYAAFHLPPSAIQVIADFNRAYPLIGVTVVSSILRTTLFLPALAALGLFIRWSALRTFFPAIVAAFGLMLLYSAARWLQYTYLAVVAKPTIVLTKTILMLLPGGMPVSATGMTMRYGSFSAIIGPPCLGLDALILFAALFGGLWLMTSRVRTVRSGRAIVALIAGVAVLFLLNAVRVAAILVVGNHSSHDATELFHQGIGSLFVLGLFIVYLRWVAPWMSVAKRRTASKPATKTKRPRRRKNSGA